MWNSKELVWPEQHRPSTALGEEQNGSNRRQSMMGGGIMRSEVGHAGKWGTMGSGTSLGVEQWEMAHDRRRSVMGGGAQSEARQ